MTVILIVLGMVWVFMSLAMIQVVRMDHEIDSLKDAIDRYERRAR